MDIKSSSLFAQMQQMATEATGDRMVTNNKQLVTNDSTSEFGNMLKQAVNTVNELQGILKERTTAFEMGDRSVSLAEVMIAKEKSGIAFEATVQVRNKLVEAYKEIMSMPV